MLTRVLHVSDLHVGARAAAAEWALAPLVEEYRPELVIASGDLTNRGRAAEHDTAAALLRELGPPLLTVPGNHDIPYTFPKRLTRPWAEFERVWETTEPVFRSEHVLAVGLNSVRPWRHQSGRVGDARLEHAAGLLRAADAGPLKVAVLHHHPIGAPWRSRKKPVARRNHVLASLVDAGAELILAGHIHQGAVSERREFEIAAGGEHGVVAAVAPGLGQPRPHRRGEARGLHVYEFDAHHLHVLTFVWREAQWQLTARRTFARGRAALD